MHASLPLFPLSSLSLSLLSLSPSPSTLFPIHSLSLLSLLSLSLPPLSFLSLPFPSLLSSLFPLPPFSSLSLLSLPSPSLLSSPSLSLSAEMRALGFTRARRRRVHGGDGVPERSKSKKGEREGNVPTARGRRRGRRRRKAEKIAGAKFRQPDGGKCKRLGAKDLAKFSAPRALLDIGDISTSG
jgi:hypothetical protein